MNVIRPWVERSIRGGTALLRSAPTAQRRRKLRDGAVECLNVEGLLFHVSVRLDSFVIEVVVVIVVVVIGRRLGAEVIRRNVGRRLG